MFAGRLRRLAIVIPLAVLSNAAIVVGRSLLEAQFSAPVHFESIGSTMSVNWTRLSSSFGESISVVCMTGTSKRLENEAMVRSLVPRNWKQRPYRMGYCGNAIEDFAEVERSGWPFRCCSGSRGRFSRSGYATSGLTSVTLPQWPLPRATFPTPSKLSNLSGADAAYAADLANTSFPIVLTVAYRPEWPALIGNILAHAALWSIPLIGFATIRQAIAARRNHCPHCNYDLQSTPLAFPCPECGNPR